MKHRYKYIYIAIILIINILFSLYFFAYAKEWMYTTPEEYVEAHKNYVENDQIEKARNIMAEMLERYPTNPNALFYKAGLLFNEGNYDGAIEYLKRCIEYNKDYARAYWYLGIIYGRQNHDSQAEEYLRKSIELNPNTAARANLAELYASQGKFDLANEEISSYFKYATHPNQYSYIVAANIHNNLGKDEKVIEDCQKGLDVDGADPRNVDLLLTLSKTYEKLGRYQEALDTYTFAYSWHKTITAFKDGIDRVKQKLKTKQGGQ